jgi:hypothetical protein
MRRFIYLSVLVSIIFLSCEKEKIETDPKKAILGKWEITQLGNWPSMEYIEDPLGYEEYLPDSVIRQFDYKTNTNNYKKYWIEDSILYISTLREDGFELIFEYKYTLFDKNNKLRLDAYSLMIFNTSIYKRLK